MLLHYCSAMVLLLLVLLVVLLRVMACPIDESLLHEQHTRRRLVEVEWTWTCHPLLTPILPRGGRCEVRPSGADGGSNGQHGGRRVRNTDGRDDGSGRGQFCYSWVILKSTGLLFMKIIIIHFLLCLMVNKTKLTC
jgi:hypothetical protein